MYSEPIKLDFAGDMSMSGFTVLHPFRMDSTTSLNGVSSWRILFFLILKVDEGEKRGKNYRENNYENIQTILT